MPKISVIIPVYNTEKYLKQCLDSVINQSLQDIGYGTDTHFGTVELRDAILEKKPKLHLSGHIHTADHNPIMIGDTKHYNVSYLDEKYTPTFEPLYLDI